jgi:hypothetical protein
LDDGVREVVGGVAQCFAGKFEEETACFVRVGRGEGVGLLSVRKIFRRATRDGGRAGGFCGRFFLGTTGGHNGVWRETGSERKENFSHHRQPRLAVPRPPTSGQIKNFNHSKRVRVVGSARSRAKSNFALRNQPFVIKTKICL